MSKSAFIVIETKNGRATPSSVWEASSEQDYMNRVAASNPRSGDDFTDFQATLDGDAERHAMSVQIMRQADFDTCHPDDLDARILRQAERLGWYQPEAEAE